MDKELLSKLREKNKGFGKGKQEWAICEEYREIVWKARDKAKEAKTQLELNLARNIKDSRKGFYRYVVSKSNLGIRRALSRRKQETWLPWTKRKLRFSITSVPHSSTASVPAIPPKSRKRGTEKMKTLSPLRFKAT